MIPSVKIEDFVIGTGNPCFIIAEAGVNHNGDMKLAHKLIDEAAEAGADAVKFQSFIAEDLVTAEAQKAKYQVETTGQDGGQFAMLKKLELSKDQQKELKTHCDEAGILYLCKKKLVWRHIKLCPPTLLTFLFFAIWHGKLFL